MVHLYQCGVTRVSSSFARWMRHRLCVYTQNVADSHALEACEKLRVLLVIVRQLDKDIFYSCWTKLAYQVVAQFYHLSTCINFLVWVISSICSFCWYLLPVTPETHPIGSHSLSWIHSPSWHWASPSAKHVHCYFGEHQSCWFFDASYVWWCVILLHYYSASLSHLYILHNSYIYICDWYMIIICFSNNMWS